MANCDERPLMRECLQKSGAGMSAARPACLSPFPNMNYLRAPGGLAIQACQSLSLTLPNCRHRGVGVGMGVGVEWEWGWECAGGKSSSFKMYMHFHHLYFLYTKHRAGMSCCGRAKCHWTVIISCVSV